MRIINGLNKWINKCFSNGVYVGTGFDTFGQFLIKKTSKENGEITV